MANGTVDEKSLGQPSEAPLKSPIQPHELNDEMGRQVRDELGDEAIVKMYADMCRLRRFEEHAGRAYQMRKIKGFCHLYIGQEAVGVGAAAALTPKDYVVSHYREHGHALAAGMTSRSVMAELFAKATGCSGGKGGSMHLFDVEKKFLGGWGIVGGQIGLATGVAFASKYRNDQSVCLCYFGDGAIHQGMFHESFNMAALWGLPVVYITENNGYGMGTALQRASAVVDLRKKAASYDMATDRIDGQDIFETYLKMKAAIDRARLENKPTYLDVITYRYRGHSMTDPGTYRSKEEVEQYQDLQDPIVRLRLWLIKVGIRTEEQLVQIDVAANEEAKDAVQFADESPFPDPAELTTDVYVEWPWSID